MLVSFVDAGILSFTNSVGIIIGSNIGTTTALIASTVTGKQCKRVAITHFLFNLFGVIIFLPFIKIFSNFISHINIGLAEQVAVSHLIFNIIIALIFIIIIKPFTNLIYKIIK